MQYDFPQIDKSEWLTKVQRDLRGRELSELNHKVGELTLSPFWHAEDLTSPPLPVFQHTGWRIGQSFDVSSPAATNAAILKALNRGVSAIYLNNAVADDTTDEERSAMLDGVLLDLVEVYYEVKGSVRDETRQQYFSTNFGPFNVANLAYDLFSAYDDYLREGYFAPTFHVAIDADYFGAIAKLRALRLCWRQLSLVTGRQTECNIVVHGILSDKMDELHTNKISATTRAMAAVLGGANTIIVYPSDPGNDDDFNMRIATNVHHLLQYEAQFGVVADPASGSYYLESLTDRLAVAIWSEVQSLTQKHKS